MTRVSCATPVPVLLVLSSALVKQIFAILDVSQSHVRLFLTGRKIGDSVAIETVSQRGHKRPGGDRRQSHRWQISSDIVGEMIFHADHLNWLTMNERRHVTNMLRRKKEYVLVLAVASPDGDLAFYPLYFSKRIPMGFDMILEYDGSAVVQQQSALRRPPSRRRRTS